MIRILVISVVLFLPFGSKASSVYTNFKAYYEFDFSGLVVARGELVAKLDNQTYEIYFSGKTTSVLRWLYRLNVSIKDVIDVRDNRDLYYESYQKTSKKYKYFFIKFDNGTTAKVLYKKNNYRRTYLITAKSRIYSPLSVYLFFLTHRYQLGRVYYRNIVISKNLYRVKIIPVKVEVMNINHFGVKKIFRRVLKVQLYFYKMTRQGAFEENKKVKKLIAWISLKPPQLPLVVDLWHVIGVFRARLVKLELEKQDISP